MPVMWGTLCGLFVLAAWGAHALFRSAGVDLGFWQWTFLLGWLLWTFFGVAVVWTFISEQELRPAAVSSVLFSTVSVVLAVVFVVVVLA